MSDLVIGTRRSSNRLRAAIAIAVVLATIAVVTRLIYSKLVSYPDPDVRVDDAALSFADQRLSTAGGSLEFLGGVPVMTLTGSPGQIGFAHGRLASSRVAQNIRELARPLIETVPEGGLLGPLRHARLRWRLRLLDDGIPGHQLVEMRALARGAGQDDRYEALVRGHASLDVGVPTRATLGRDLQQMVRALSVVVPVRNEQGDRLMIARSLSLPGLSTVQSPATVFVVRGDDAIPFASLGRPGDTGVLTGVNAEGIAVLVHPGRTSDVRFSRHGQPAALIAREVLEQARGLADAVKIIDKAEHLGAAVFLVVDGKERKHVVIERSPKRRAQDEGRTVVDGVFQSKSFRDDPINDRLARSSVAKDRRKRAATLARRARKRGAEGLVELLRDRRGSGDAPLPAGHRATIDDPLAEQVAIIDPSTMLMWVGEGPGAAGAMRAIDLRHRLSDGSSASTAPADLPAASGRAAEALAAARRDLVRALELSAQGRHGRASERAELALSRAPSWPQAQLIAGRLAARAGRQETAFRHFRAFLQAPDSPAARDQVEAEVGQQR